MNKKIGLIAGNGRFPVLFVKSAKDQGVEVVAICIRQDTDKKVAKLAEKSHWVNVWEFQKIFEIFKAEGITSVAMAGQISPYLLFRCRKKFDKELTSLLSTLSNKKADTIFGKIADKLKENNIELIDSTIYVKEHLPGMGVLSKRAPDSREQNDIKLGFHTAKHIGEIDIGQTVAVKDGCILAVEAFEGTDNAIKRAGKLGGQGVVVVKTAKPNQDMRFDVPLIGTRTIKTAIGSGVSCLAFEADKTLMLDRDECLVLADKNNLAIVAVEKD